MNRFAITTFAIAALALPHAASAAVLSFEFTGEVTGTNDGSNNDVAAVGNLAVGNAVSGSFLLDTSLITGGGGNVTTYASSATDFRITIGADTYSSSLAATTIRNDHQAGSGAPLRDVFYVQSESTLGPIQDGLAGTYFRFAFGSTDTSILDSTAMPTIDQLFALLAADTVGGNLAFLTFEGGTDVRYDVTSMTIDGYAPTAPVPLPAALPMLLMGLGALGLARRKSKTN